jgi:hypothetical protein
MTDLITLKPTFIDRGGAQVYDVIEDAERPLSSINRGQTRLAPDPRIKELEAVCSSCYDAQQRGEERIKELGAQVDAVRGCQRWEQGESRGYALGNAPMVKDDEGEYLLFDDVLAALGEQE